MIPTHLRRPALALLTVGLAACSSNTEPSDSGAVTFVSCNSAWVAVQDGDGAWTQVVPSGSNYQFTLESGRGGFARVQVHTRPDYTTLDVVNGTVAEVRNAATFAGTSSCGEPVYMLGTLVGGFESSITTAVHLGGWTTYISRYAEDFQAYGVPGLQDLYALRPSFEDNPPRVLQRPGVNVTSGGILAPLDFTGPEAFVPVTSILTIAGMSGDTALVASSFRGHDHSTDFDLNRYYATAAQAASGVRYESIPVARLQSGDMQLIEAFSWQPGSGSGYQVARAYFTTPADRTLTLGPSLSVPTGSIVATTPNLRLRVQVAAQPEYGRAMTATFEQRTTYATDSVSVVVTAKYLGGTPTTWDITIPDFSDVAGWNAAWGLTNETTLSWSMVGQDGVVPMVDGVAASGGTTRSASRPPAP